jgi:hypothetical protein
MERYRNLGGDSGVVAYEIGHGSITVEFAAGTYKFYLYDAIRPGASMVSELQRLASAGQGLNSYIGRVVKGNYSRKW